MGSGHIYIYRWGVEGDNWLPAYPVALGLSAAVLAVAVLVLVPVPTFRISHPPGPPTHELKGSERDGGDGETAGISKCKVCFSYSRAAAKRTPQEDKDSSDARTGAKGTLVSSPFCSGQGRISEDTRLPLKSEGRPLYASRL